MNESISLSAVIIERFAEGSALITNQTGLHARPAVKLTKLAKTFDASIRLRVGAEGKWFDAKSVVKVMALKAPLNETLYFQADGGDALSAVEALTALVQRDFDEGSPTERQFEGQAASAGVSEGVIVLHTHHADDHDATPRERATEQTALEGALAKAGQQLEELVAKSGAMAAEILEFQLALLGDPKLTEPAYTAIAAGSSAAAGWRTAVDAEIAGYLASDDDYFRARASDLADLRDRVLGVLKPEYRQDKIPAETSAIYVSHDLAPSRFLEIDWSRYRGAALLAGSTNSHVAMLARSRGVPMLVGVRAKAEELADGAPAILDAEVGRLIQYPCETTLRQQRERVSARLREQELAERYRHRPAATGTGKRITLLINVEDPDQLALVDPAQCDGIGLTRTEFLFHRVEGLPDEETQFQFYKTLIDWAAGRSVTIRTLDAGGDKPIAELTPEGEANPFLGVRGIRLSLARPEVFRVQLRALARIAALGTVKVMLPMVTLPGELICVRLLFAEVLKELAAQGIAAKMPALGMMVEVPAAAIAIASFNADFYSIGSNDLIQYVTAASRDSAAVANLYDPRNPAVLELIARVASHGVTTGKEVSLCGEMASDPELTETLLQAGLTTMSVAPAALARVKLAIARFGAAA